MLCDNQEIKLKSIGVEALLSSFFQYLFNFFFTPIIVFSPKMGLIRAQIKKLKNCRVQSGLVSS